MNENFFQPAKEYLQVHWMAMLLGAIPTTIVGISVILSLIINFRLDYQALKLTVSAQGIQDNSLYINEQQLLKDDSQIKQQQVDQGKQLDSMQSNIEDIHRYFFDGGK